MACEAKREVDADNMVIMPDKSEFVERRREILGEEKKGMVISHPRVRYDGEIRSMIEDAPLR
jgi:hypothetical protein